MLNIFLYFPLLVLNGDSVHLVYAGLGGALALGVDVDSEWPLVRNVPRHAQPLSGLLGPVKQEDKLSQDLSVQNLLVENVLRLRVESDPTVIRCYQWDASKVSE